MGPHYKYSSNWVIKYCGGKRPDNPNLCICWTKGPIRRLGIARGQEKTLPKGSALVREGMESDQNHLASGSRKSPSLARQCRGEKGWPAIKSDTPDHPVEHDKYWERTGQRKA